MPRRAGAGSAQVVLLAVALAAGAAADGEEDHAQAALDAGEAFDPRKAMTEFLEYQASHPEFAAGVATWVTVGILLFVIGTVILVWSEAHAMLGLSNLSAPPDTPRERETALRACVATGAQAAEGGIRRMMTARSLRLCSGAGPRLPGPAAAAGVHSGGRKYQRAQRGRGHKHALAAISIGRRHVAHLRGPSYSDLPAVRHHHSNRWETCIISATERAGQRSSLALGAPSLALGAPRRAVDSQTRVQDFRPRLAFCSSPLDASSRPSASPPCAQILKSTLNIDVVW
jgi:hypothetical protein